MSRTSIGNAGEAEAARYLRKKGYKLLASQWRCRFGELDLVARDRGGTICFVEVKLRKSDAYGGAGEAVDRRKQEKLRVTAQLYLAEHPTRLQPRFDVVEVYAPRGRDTLRPTVLRIENAF